MEIASVDIPLAREPTAEEMCMLMFCVVNLELYCFIRHFIVGFAAREGEILSL